MAITKKQTEFLDYIRTYITENGVSPTQAEIKDHFEFRSLGSVQDYLKYLTKEGLLKIDRNSVRGIKTIDQCPTCGKKMMKANIRQKLFGKGGGE